MIRFMTKDERVAIMNDSMLDYFNHKIHNSVLLSKHLKRPISVNPKLKGNGNVIGIGGVGSGKSMALALPNIMQRDCSYVITDPGGEFLRATGTALEESGYEIKVINLIHPERSHHYNPLTYVKDEFQLQDLFQCMIQTAKANDISVLSPEYFLFAACVLLLKSQKGQKSATLKMVADMLQAIIIDNGVGKTIDEQFLDLPTSSRARVAYMHIFGLSPTDRKICASNCLAYLYPFLSPELLQLTKNDDLELEHLGRKKIAVFLITPIFERTHMSIVPIFYTQILRELCKDKINHPPVKLILDDFANYGTIPILGQYLSVTQQYNVSIMILLQSFEQIKKLYPDQWKLIVANCSTVTLLSSPIQLTVDMPLCKALFELETEQMVQEFEHFLISEQYKNHCIVKMIGMPPCIDSKILFKKDPAYLKTAYGSAAYAFQLDHLFEVAERSKKCGKN